MKDNYLYSYLKLILNNLQELVKKSGGSSGGGSGGGGGTGDASAAKQDIGNASLSSIDGKTPSNPSLEHTAANSPSSVRLTDGTNFYSVSTAALSLESGGNLADLNSKVPAQVSGRIPVDPSGVTQPISASSLPLPTGAATSANQATEISSLSTIATNSLVSTANSSTATLGSSAIFTGTSEDIAQYGFINITVFSNVASATDGLSVQQSSDGTNWDILDVYTIPAGIGKTFSINRSARYFRLVYTNGASGQSAFRLSTIFTKYGSRPSSVRPQDLRTNDNDMEEVIGYNAIYDPINNVWNRQAPFIAYAGAATQTATVNNILTTVSGSAGVDVRQYSFGSVQVVSTGTGGTFIFEFANLDGSYQTMPVWNNTVLTGTPITGAITATSSSLIYYFPITTNFIRLRIATTITGGSIQAISKLTTYAPYPSSFQVAQATAANLNATVTGTVTSNLGTGGTGATSLGKAEDAVAASGDTGVFVFGVRRDTIVTSTDNNGDYTGLAADQFGSLQVKSLEKQARTYSACAAVTPASAATDIFNLVGNGTTVCYVTKFIISGTQTTAGTADFLVIKRTTANTGGTSVGATAVGHSGADTAQSTVVAYSANPSALGTAAGTIRRLSVLVPTTVSIVNSVYTIEFGDKGKPVIVSGVAQSLAVNLNGATLTGGSLSICIEWYEI